MARSKSTGLRKVQSPAAGPATDGAPKLGTRIRELRRARSWLLSDLSDRSGIAVSTLSKVENHALSLTYDRLQQVADAFEMSISEFLAPPEAGEPAPASARISWARKGSGAHIDNSIYLCDNLRAKAMVPTLTQCIARTLEEYGPMLKHHGEEFIFVVQGRVQINTEYYGPETLEAGEGVYIDSRMGHACLNAGEGEAWILSVSYG